MAQGIDTGTAKVAELEREALERLAGVQDEAAPRGLVPRVPGAQGRQAERAAGADGQAAGRGAPTLRG
jgi:hypothetical protein